LLFPFWEQLAVQTVDDRLNRRDHDPSHEPPNGIQAERGHETNDVQSNITLPHGLETHRTAFTLASMELLDGEALPAAPHHARPR
jgi:hypothetical protein